MTGWTVTSSAARLGRLVGLRGRWTTPYAAAHAAGRAQRGGGGHGDTVFARAYARRLARASAADAKALATALSEVGEDADVIRRAAASGAPIAAIAALAAGWANLPSTARAVIREPAGSGMGALRYGGVRARQVDRTTCGAAVMAVMLMTGDPLVAAWLMTGRHCGDYLPPEVLRIVVSERPSRTIEERWSALQSVLHDQVRARGLAVLPWPRRFGTPPWRVDEETRFAGVAFRGAILDDTSTDVVAAAVAHASAALRDGIPVPMFTGGDSSGGLSQVMPRHVVLLVGRTSHGFAVYEPGTGRVVPLTEARLYGPGPQEPAYGHWTRACWMVLPQRKSEA
ncbi:hypothetical protein [Demequina activiva]|uniref:Uncharacterized protein n=1 Tax=Demequina activiva TaxID=1582364 RepID=A0A919UFJ7_9MICO|nr:hypothetical protein [Demequina activiva]GIG53544.1 hypothetical protein Dac01nite_02960 [Demequina activiva]